MWQQNSGFKGRYGGTRVQVLKFPPCRGPQHSARHPNHRPPRRHSVHPGCSGRGVATFVSEPRGTTRVATGHGGGASRGSSALNAGELHPGAAKTGRRANTPNPRIQARAEVRRSRPVPTEIKIGDATPRELVAQRARRLRAADTHAAVLRITRASPHELLKGDRLSAYSS